MTMSTGLFFDGSTMPTKVRERVVGIYGHGNSLYVISNDGVCIISDAGTVFCSGTRGLSFTGCACYHNGYVYVGNADGTRICRVKENIVESIAIIDMFHEYSSQTKMVSYEGLLFIQDYNDIIRSYDTSTMRFTGNFLRPTDYDSMSLLGASTEGIYVFRGMRGVIMYDESFNQLMSSMYPSRFDIAISGCCNRSNTDINEITEDVVKSSKKIHNIISTISSYSIPMAFSGGRFMWKISLTRKPMLLISNNQSSIIRFPSNKAGGDVVGNYFRAGDILYKINEWHPRLFHSVCFSKHQTRVFRYTVRFLYWLIHKQIGMCPYLTHYLMRFIVI